MTLCIGPEGSGKTLLLQSLRRPGGVDATTASVPTTGTNMFAVPAGGGGAAGAATAAAAAPAAERPVRELGGAVAPLWAGYYRGVGRVLYVVDASNLCQIAAAGVLLYAALAHPDLAGAKFLIVLAKMDQSYRQMRNEALLMLQMKRLQKEVSQQITVCESSAVSGIGRDEILSWIATGSTNIPGNPKKPQPVQ